MTPVDDEYNALAAKLREARGDAATPILKAFTRSIAGLKPS